MLPCVVVVAIAQAERLRPSARPEQVCAERRGCDVIWQVPTGGKAA